ncbi:GNAT family N-acetyltransferase [Nocardia vinacea]|uniref:GNAT family N-acetyltransferase n=1 Tax=Nocardia vinacea TaxID=96468 RepID=UPI0033D93C17
MASISFAIRELGPDDTNALRELHAGLDEQDSYFRFFAPLPRNLDKVAAAIAKNDPTHCAVGAFIDGRLVGVANFIALEQPRTAEVAMVVAHDEQTHGIGTDLLYRLADLARERGIERFVADVLPANAKMMRLINESDFPVITHRQNGIVRVAIQL